MVAAPHEDVTAARLNPLALVSVIAAVVAVASMFSLGNGAATTFAVGAGHVALCQIRQRNERGRTLALIGLLIGYGIAVWSIIMGITLIPFLIQQHA